MYSILALGSGCVIVFLLYKKIGLTFSCYVAVPIVAPIALCGFDSYNGMGFREVFTRYMRSIFRNKALVFQSSGYREMVSEIKAPCSLIPLSLSCSRSCQKNLERWRCLQNIRRSSGKRYRKSLPILAAGMGRSLFMRTMRATGSRTTWWISLWSTW
ncbi:PrgI family protein [Lachnospiraceae bacterium]|nr:PrgI family protein [Lachnospiraceae bacterium]